MEELLELRGYIEQQNYTEALDLIGEMEDMSRKSILRNIRAYLVRLLVHLIKNQVEQRLTNSWAASIRGSVLEIRDLNLKGNHKSYYIKTDDWQYLLEESFEDAVYEASGEVLSGKHTPLELIEQVDYHYLYKKAQIMLSDTYHYNRRELSVRINAYLATLPDGERFKI